jgi:hypothetical protein
MREPAHDQFVCEAGHLLLDHHTIHHLARLSVLVPVGPSSSVTSRGVEPQPECLLT